MSFWYVRDPRRFAQEVLAWREHDFSLDLEALRSHHRVHFDGSVTSAGGKYRVTVDYPDGFPYVRPDVRLPDLLIQPTDQHRTLADGVLCLRGYFPDQWSNSDLGVSLLPDVERWIESHHSGVWQNPHNAPDLMVLNRRTTTLTVVFDDAGDSEPAPDGQIRVDVLWRSGNAPLLHVRQIGALKYAKLAEGESRTGIYTSLPGAPVALARAMLKDGRVSADDAQRLIQSGGGTVVRPERKKNKPAAEHQIIAIRFAMQSGSRQQTVWEVLSWDSRERVYIAAQVHYRSDTFNRVRNVLDLDALQKAHVAVLGVGAIGGTVALELARAGVGNLTLVDNDLLAIGNLARHVCELQQVGLPKTSAVAEQIRRRFPGVKLAEGVAASSPITNLYTHFDQLFELARAVDTVAVCVGNHNLHHFVNDAMLAANRTAVYAWVGPDASAGRVVRIEPRVTGCYWCYYHWVEEEQSDYFYGLPDIEDINALPLDYGCNTPAVPGSSFDHGRIALAQTRQIVQAILGPAGKYPYDETPHLLLTNRVVSTIPDSDFEHVISYSKVQRVPYCPKCGTGLEAETPVLSDDEQAVITQYLPQQ